MSAAGERRLYAEYEITSGRRGLYAQRINGQVALTDAPLEGHGRVYLIDRHISSVAELDGLTYAYIEHSIQADEPGVIASRRRLDELAEPIR